MKTPLAPTEALKRHHDEKTKMLVYANNDFFEMSERFIMAPHNAAVYFAICAHAKRAYTGNSHQIGESSPSLSRLSVLLGMKRANLIECIDNFASIGLFTITHKKLRGGRHLNVYHIDTEFIEKHEKPFVMSQYMFFGGAWAFLKPSERLVWLLCRASAWYGGELTGHTNDVIFTPSGEMLNQHEVWFIPEQHIKLSRWSRLYHISTRTLRTAFEGLKEKGFIWTADGYTTSGLAFRVYPNVPDNYPGWAEHLVRFYGRLDAIRQPTVSTSTRRLLTQLSVPFTPPAVSNSLPFDYGDSVPWL